MIKGRSDWIPFVVASVTAVLNLVVYGPRTQELMIERVHQGTIVMLDDDKFSR